LLVPLRRTLEGSGRSRQGSKSQTYRHAPGQACHQVCLAFLRLIDEQSPADLDIHIIADNYATHKHSQVEKWLGRHPRLHTHYTPTSSSWMNLVERFFGDLTAFIIERSFASTRELANATITFLADRNDNPRRYVWKAKGEDILRKIDTARRALVVSQAQRNLISETPQ
jgi:transposase